jgi:hypothetical protein
MYNFKMILRFQLPKKESKQPSKEAFVVLVLFTEKRSGVGVIRKRLVNPK